VTWHWQDVLALWMTCIALLYYVRKNYPWWWFRIFGYSWIGLFAYLFLEKMRRA